MTCQTCLTLNPPGAPGLRALQHPAAGTSRAVTVTLLDDAGRYRWKLGR